MKSETLQGLLTARVLFERAENLCRTEDRHLVSAGLLLLQDALELVFHALLIEREIDERRSIENLTFPDLLGTLKSEGVPITKSGTLKALNRDRLNIKHYARLAEPSNVHNYLDTSQKVIDHALNHVIGKSLRDVFLTDLLEPGDRKTHVEDALRAVEENHCLDALISVRKSVFLAVEQEYAIDLWRNAAPSGSGFAPLLYGRGFKAPYYAQSREFVDNMVTDPFEFIRIDNQRLTLDLMEWGVPTQDFWNVVRLTPAVFRFHEEQRWHVKVEAEHLKSATPEVAQYCIDRAISILSNQQYHRRAARWPELPPGGEFRVRVTAPEPLYQKATTESDVIDTLSPGTTYGARAILDGFDGEKYARLFHFEPEMNVIAGYVRASACEYLSEEPNE